MEARRCLRSRPSARLVASVAPAYLTCVPPARAYNTTTRRHSGCTTSRITVHGISRMWMLCVVVLVFSLIPTCSAQSPSKTSSPGSLATPTPIPPPPSTLPAYLYPDIIDLGPPNPNGLEFGIILPLNLSMSDDSYWRSVVIRCISAIRLAVEDINSSGILPLNITLSMRNSQPPLGSVGQDGSAAMMSSAQFVSNNVSALIGDTVSWLTAYSASMTSALRIPQCSFSSISNDLSSKTLYGYFFRTTPTGGVISDVFLQYIQAMGWRRIGIVYTSDAFGLSLATAIANKANEYGIQVVYWEVIYLPSSNATAFERTMENLRTHGSYINLLLTTDTDLLRALEDIQNAGMFRLPYQWITLNNVANDVSTYFSVPGRPSPSNFNGLVMLDLFYDLKGDPEYDKFLQRWQKLDPQYYPGAGPGSELNYNQGRAYSCVQMLALGYQKDIQEAKRLGHNDTFILEQLKAGTYPRTIGNLSASHFASIEYDGPAGKMILNQNGDPQSGSWIFYQLQNNVAVKVGSSDPFNRTRFARTIIPGAHYWPGYGPTAPPDGPNWILQNLRWTEPIAQAFGILANMGILASLIIMGIVIWKRKDPVIKASSPYFCVLEIVGIILVYLVVPMRAGKTRVASCTAIPLIIILGSTLLLGSLIVKNLRIYRIFSNVFYNKYSIKNSVLARQVVVILIVCMLAPTLYIVIARPVPSYTLIGPTKTAILCLPSNDSLNGHAKTIFMVFMVIPNLFLLIVAGYLAYSTQHVAANWNEAKAMAYTIYNILFATLICIPTMFFPNDLYRVTLYIQNSMIIFAASVALMSLFGPKLLVMRRRALRARKQSASSSSTGYNHSSYSHSHSGSGNSRNKERTADRDFCRSRGSKEFSSSPCPHTVSTIQRALSPSTLAMRDGNNLVGSFFGLQQRYDSVRPTGAGDEGRRPSFVPIGEGNSFERPAVGDEGYPLGEEATVTTVPPFPSSSRTDYFQHPRAALAAQEPVDLLGPRANVVHLTNLVAPSVLNPNAGEPQQFDAIRFRTGVLDHNHSAHHPHNDDFDLHVPEEDFIGGHGHHAHNLAMMISRQRGGAVQLGSGTIPVLVHNTRRWISRAAARWRAMRVIVVSSLGMVMLIDVKKVKTETFLYTHVAAETEHRHFFIRVCCEQGYELRLEYPCAQARDLWLRSFTTMGTIHDSNQLTPLRHRHNATGSSNASNNSSNVAINQQPRQLQTANTSSPLPPNGSGSATTLSSGSCTPAHHQDGAPPTIPDIIASVMELAELGRRPREHRDSNGSDAPLALSTLQQTLHQQFQVSDDTPNISPRLNPIAITIPEHP